MRNINLCFFVGVYLHVIACSRSNVTTGVAFYVISTGFLICACYGYAARHRLSRSWVLLAVLGPVGVMALVLPSWIGRSRRTRAESFDNPGRL